MSNIEFTPTQERVIQDAVNWFLYSSQQTFQFCGPAGTGKSVVLNEIIRRLKLKEYQFMPMAFTGQAAIIMRLRGLTSAKSIHSSLYEFVEMEDKDAYDTAKANTQFNRPPKRKVFQLKHKNAIPKEVKLFVIDEGYMVPRTMRENIESFGRKILVCGDDRQLPPVSGEPAYFMESGVHRLTEIMRQVENSPLLYLANRALANKPIDCGLYGSSVLVIEDKDIDYRLLNAANAIVCGTNKTRDYMNKMVRERLHGIDSDLPVYGERVICRNNNWNMVRDNIALANGLIGTVTNLPNVGTYDGQTFTIDFVPDLFPSVFDGLQVNYEYFKSDYTARQAMKNQEHFVGEMFEFAYANTVYLVQGAEFNQGVYIEEFLRPNIQSALNYTAITRFRNAMVYVKKSKNFSIFIDKSLR